MVYQPEYEKYKGLRALILTRVSGKAQEKKFGHPAQERRVRDDITSPLMHHVIGVIHDTYTGLEYQYREALDRILRMAEAGEFDVLCMDVLDRGLGRKAVARELYRMQLRDFGIHVLTTEPSDHADDDSFEGQTTRLRKGLKAEEEILDMVRRTTNGRREKALGNPEENIPPQIVGSAFRCYGYKFVRNAKGVCIGYELNLDVIYIDKDGVKWTEVMIVRFIFESAANGISLHQMAATLNEKGVPTPFMSKGVHYKNMKEDPRWQSMNLGRLLKNTAYYGEYRYGKTVPVRVPGRKRPLVKKVPPEEHIIVPVPAIVTKAQWEKANWRASSNKQIATRNNQNSKLSLLRGGFARCAYCGRSLAVRPISHKGRPTDYSYNCSQPFLKNGRCPGCTIYVTVLDRAAVEYIKEIICDPSAVDTAIQELLKENPLKKRQQKALKDLNKILAEQATLRANLSREMKKKDFSERTVAVLGKDLKDLEQQEKEAREHLANQQEVQQQYDDLDHRIAEFHTFCTEWREKLDKPEFQPDFHFYQEAVIFFGISVKVWKSGTDTRYEFYSRPPAIVELLS